MLSGNWLIYMLVNVSNHLKRVHPGHKRIIRGMVSVSFFVTIAKVIAATKEMAVAYRYGTSAIVDGYLFVFNLVNWPISIYFSVVSVVLIPLIVRIRKENPSSLKPFQAELLGATFLLGGGITCLAGFGIPILIKATWIGLNPIARKTALQAVPWMVWLISLGMVSALIASWMMSREQYINTLFEAIPALMIGGFVLLWPIANATPLVLGAVLGFLGQALLLLFVERKFAFITLPRLGFQSKHWGLFLSGVGIITVLQGVGATTSLSDQFFVAHLGQGAIAALGYAKRLSSLVLGLSATAVGRATLPVFSRYRTNGEKPSARRMAQQWAVFSFGLGIFISAVGWIVAPFLVKSIFEHGVFTSRDTRIVARLFRLLLLQLPAYLPELVIMQWILSARMYQYLVYMAALIFVVKLASNALFVDLYGIDGIAISETLTYIVAVIYLFIHIRNKT